MPDKDQVKRRVHLSGTETQHGRAAMAAQEALFNMKLDLQDHLFRPEHPKPEGPRLGLAVTERREETKGWELGRNPAAGHGLPGSSSLTLDLY
eukprot:757549-Hanusia_phi.AAC.1